MTGLHWYRLERRDLIGFASALSKENIVNNSDLERLFIAISVPEEVKLFLKRLQDEMKKTGIRGSWVSQPNMHLTLKFLGDTRPEVRDKVQERLETAVSSISPFVLHAGGVGVFPSVRKPRVLWSKAKGETQVLQTLYERLETRLTLSGFKKEKKPFHPHFTIGRIKNRVSSQTMFEGIDRFSSYESEPFSVTGIHLFKSDLRPEGAVHTRLFTAEIQSDRRETEL